MNIKELQLLTDDLDQTNNFYARILGFEILSGGSNITRFSAGHSVLTFHKSVTEKPVYHFAFNIPNNKFDAALNWVKGKLPLIEITPANCVADFKSWNARAFYFYDNNKNIVEMICRYDLSNSSQGDFDGSSVYSVSEIGAVADDPKSFAAKLITGYHLGFFSKQYPADDFIAVGDDHGMFIIVPENRKWYPTDIRSARHWAKVTIEVPGGFSEIILNR